jgi:hypothetical protein
MIYTATGWDVSARYHYFYSRKAANTFPTVGGTFASINMQTAAKGTADIPAWPYEGEPNETPTAAANANALGYKITYYQTSTLADIQSAIASGHAVGLHVYATTHWYTPLWREDGSAEIATSEATAIGGHYVCVVGYDMNRKNADGSVGAILILNSWGTGWGKNGLAWLPLYWLTTQGGHAGSRYAITSQRPAPPPRKFYFADYVALCNNYGLPATKGDEQGDFNGDGFTNHADFTLLANGWHEGVGNAPAEPKPVTPENPMPTTPPTGTLRLLRDSAKPWDGVGYEWTCANGSATILNGDGREIPVGATSGSGSVAMPKNDLTITLIVNSPDPALDPFQVTKVCKLIGDAPTPTPTPTPTPSSSIKLALTLNADGTVGGTWGKA